MRPQAPRDGFTLIELLVTVAIIGVLVSLALMAVQAARSAARRMTCSSHARQIALALHSRHDLKGAMPAGTGISGGTHPYQGWLAETLPFIEQVSAYDEMESSYAARRSPFGAVNHLHLATSVRLFTCPDDAQSHQSVYAQNHGFMVGPSSFLGVNGPHRGSSQGAFYFGSKVRFADITDGISNTLLFGERPMSPSNDLAWWYAGVGIDGEGTGDHSLGVEELGPSPYHLHVNCGNGPFSFRKGVASDECSSLHFWSFHASGGHFARADGSVHFVTYTDSNVLVPLATKSGGDFSYR